MSPQSSQIPNNFFNLLSYLYSETGLLHFLFTFFQGLFNIYQIDGPVHFFSLLQNIYLPSNWIDRINLRPSQLLNKKKNLIVCVKKCMRPVHEEFRKTRKLNAPVSTLSTSIPPPLTPIPIYYLNFWIGSEECVRV